MSFRYFCIRLLFFVLPIFVTPISGYTHERKGVFFALSAPSYQNRFATMYGAVEFLKGIGYRDDIHDNNWVNLEPDQFLIDIAIGSLLHVIKIIRTVKNIQKIWYQIIKYMIDWDLFHSQQGILYPLYTTDFVNNYSAYYGLLGNVIDVSHMNLGNDTKFISIGLLEKYGLDCQLLEIRDRNDQNSQQIFRVTNMLYQQLIQIEKMKEQRRAFINGSMMPQVRRLSTMPVTIRPTSLQTSASHLGLTPTPSFNATPKDIMDSVLEFGKLWADENDEDQRKVLSDEELAEIFNAGDVDELNENISSKIYEMAVQQFQMEEYQKYISHFKQIRENKEIRICNDKQCGWSKTKYANGIFSLSPKQVVHVMFHHTKGIYLYTK